MIEFLFGAGVVIFLILFPIFRHPFDLQWLLGLLLSEDEHCNDKYLV